MQPKLAIACKGGGSHTAFTAGSGCAKKNFGVEHFRHLRSGGTEWHIGGWYLCHRCLVWSIKERSWGNRAALQVANGLLGRQFSLSLVGTVLE